MGGAGTRAGPRRGLTGDGQVGGGLRLAGRVPGKALQYASVVGHQPADLQAPIASLPEAAQPPHLHDGRVLVPGHGGRRHTWGVERPPSATCEGCPGPGGRLGPQVLKVRGGGNPWCVLVSRTFSVRACVLSCFSLVRLFATPWTVACQTPLSMAILQARILEWVAMPSSRGASRPRDQTCVSCGSSPAGGFFPR